MAHFYDQLSHCDYFMSIFFVLSLDFVDYLDFSISWFIVGVKVGTRNSEDDGISRVRVFFFNGLVQEC